LDKNDLYGAECGVVPNPEVFRYGINVGAIAIAVKNKFKLIDAIA
jgi:hypothetical protein